jgi:hypothetical protein
MTIFVCFSLVVLFICDYLLITYCNVKRGVPIYAFRVFVVLLAILSLMATGDITVAYGG